MVDREQQQAHQAAKSIGFAGRAGRDLIVIGVAGALMVVLLTVSGLAARALDAMGGEEPAAAVLALLIVVPVAGMTYAIRRYHDAARARNILHDLSHHDTLTGLPNRRFLTDGFDEMLRTARRVNGRVAAMFIDLDGFKRVNDTFGHEVGDRLMIAVAGRLEDALGDDDRVVRYGGDEFVALCPGATTPMAAERTARRLLEVVEAPFEIDGQVLHISGSIGIALTEERCSAPDEVLRDADAAMYKAKAQGPGRYAIFDRSLGDQVTPSGAERRLREALESGEFRLYYQPIVSLWTKRLVGVEALLRWKDPRRGMVSPAEFMPALEETGLVVPVGRWILEEVCRQSRQWQESFPDRPPVNIKVNVSARQLVQADFVDHLRHCFDTTHADPDRICLEITEAALMQDVRAAWSTLREAKAIGISLALDDFGTGYSSLAHLRQISIDLLKVDQTFVAGLGVSPADSTIVEHVVGMAKALGIVTVAEGVETEQQVEMLRAMSCDLAQGYYFSHPQPPDVIGQLLADNGNRQEWKPDRSSADDSAAVVVVADRFSPTR